MSKYLGECYCGAVKFYCDGDPFFTQYCHCNKCREVASQSKRDADKQAGIGINANNFHFASTKPESFTPVRHIWYVNRVVNFSDNLPKFKDTPKEQFGSGELWNNDDSK
jgi:hypothetical protein